MSLSLAALMLLYGTQGKKPAAAPPYVGEWVTIQAAGVQGKENLKIAKDGTFTMTITIPNVPDHVAKGHYTVKAEMPPGTEDVRDVTVYLQLESVDGKVIPKDTMAAKKLGYYSRGPILTDTLSIVFCHPGDQAKITKMFADNAASKAKSGG